MQTAAPREPIKPAGSFQEHIVIPLWRLMVWIVLINTSMFNVVLPAVISDLTITPTHGSWIVTGYSLFLAISTVTMSRLSDFIPIKTLLMVGMLMFGFASIAGFFANSFIVLISARLIQAAGAGVSQALGIVMAARYIPVSRRGRAMASISLAASLAFGLGPIVGGFIAHLFNWNFLFLLTCLVLLMLPFFYKYLPKEQYKKGKFDYLGCILISLSASSVLLFLTTLHMLFLVMMFLAAFLFIFHVKRAKFPFIQPELFGNQPYVNIIFIGFAAFSTHFAALFSMPLLLAELYDKQSLAIGFIIFPGALLSAASALFVGRLIDKFGNQMTMIAGNAFLALSSLLFCFFINQGTIAITLIYILMSIGFFTLTTSLSNELSRILPAEQIGAGLGLHQLSTLFGVGFGVSIAGLFITKLEHFNVLKYTCTFLFFFIFTLLSCFALFCYLKQAKAKAASNGQR